MPEYIAIIICIYILAAVGAMKGPCKAMGISLFEVCYVLICTLALSIFQLRIGVEISINLGAAVLICLPGLMMRKDSGKVSGVGAVMLISTVIALLKQSGALYGADNGLLCGLMAGTSAFILWDSPSCAACSAGSIPIITSVLGSFLSLVVSGYASVEIGHDIIVAQLIALSICAVIIWIHSLIPERAPTE